MPISIITKQEYSLMHTAKHIQDAASSTLPLISAGYYDVRVCAGLYMGNTPEMGPFHITGTKQE